MAMSISPQLKKHSVTIGELTPSFKRGMRVPVRTYGTETPIREMDAAVFEQISNVATLP